LPGTGGISLNQRIGDRCVGLAGDHIEPGVALRNNGRELIGPRNGPNNAFLTYACIGNRARIVSGPCAGRTGLVTGKHGGVNHVLVDFPERTMRRLRIGDRIQLESHGLGLRLRALPLVTPLNCAPELLERWVQETSAGRLRVPVTHAFPSQLMGSGFGKNNALRGDYDIQLADASARRRYRLGSLRFGDFVAICDASTSFGPSYRHGSMTVGIVVHGDSTVSGHGPGVTPLLSGPSEAFTLVRDSNANLAHVFGIRPLAPPRAYAPLTEARFAEQSSRRSYTTEEGRHMTNVGLTRRAKGAATEVT
jgi:hypothetical protein